MRIKKLPGALVIAALLVTLTITLAISLAISLGVATPKPFITWRIFMRLMTGD